MKAVRNHVHGYVHSTDSFATVDGPGIRYLVFMQGCLMRCQYCHNRDTWETGIGQQLCIDEIMADIQSYRHYLETSGGGITVSGGEPTLQAEFVTDLFKACRMEGIHTCLDTNGFVRQHNSNIDNLLAVTDLVLLDMKCMDDKKHIELTGVSNRHTLNFALHLAEINKPTWVRNVVVDGFTACEKEMHALGKFVQPMQNVQRIELLGYHQLGKNKWHAMGQDYPLENVKPPSQKQLNRLKTTLSDYHQCVIA